MTEAVGARGRYRCPFGPAPLQDFQPVFDNLVLARKTRFYHQTKTADVFGIHRAGSFSGADCRPTPRRRPPRDARHRHLK
jgi:hypothetical protein